MLGHRLVSQPKYFLCTTNPYLEFRIHFPASDLGGDPVPHLLIYGSNVAERVTMFSVGLGCANV